MDIVSRAQWGARPPRSRRTISLPTPELFLHHTAGSEPDGTAGVRRVQDFHMDVRGWSDIAYSFLVDRYGVVFEGRGAGVSGAHTKGHNTTSHAICVLGHYDREEPSVASVSALGRLVDHGRREGWWHDLTGGHRDVASTSCPGDNLYRLIGTLDVRTELAQAVVGHTAADLEQGRVLAAAYDAALVRVSADGVLSAERSGAPVDVKFAWLVGSARKTADVSVFPDGHVSIVGQDRDETAGKLARVLLNHPPDTIRRRGRPW